MNPLWISASEEENGWLKCRSTKISDREWGMGGIAGVQDWCCGF
jgi:hypothetical protein